MTDLGRIPETIETTVSADFLAADSPSAVAEWSTTATELITSESTDITDLIQLVDSVMSAHERYDASMDRVICVDLHRALPISRRLAADRRMWDWLGLVCMPDFVAFRWKPGPSGQRSLERFSGNRVRQTFARLWWIAELTRDNESYELTNRLLSLGGFQDLNEGIFGRTFGNYRPALEAYINAVEGKSEEFARRLARDLGYLFTTLSIESMDTGTLAKEMGELSKAYEQ